MELSMKTKNKEPIENSPNDSRWKSQTNEPALEKLDPELLERALASSAEGITISDARLPDNPIVYANEGFERLTGYSREDILGRNCRFLQGKDTEPDAVSVIRKGIDDGSAITVELLNYKKDGTAFWNRLSITPVKSPSQTITHYIGVQSDLTKQKDIEAELRRTTRQLEDAYGELKKDVEAAARIQRALLPSSLPQLEEVRFAWDFRPSADLAGDFLNIVPLSDHQLGIYILDVSGHGVAASLLSVTLSRWLSANPYQSFLLSQGTDGSRPKVTPPTEVVSRLNHQLLSDLTNEQYFTLIYGILDLKTFEFCHISAGHSGPLHVRHDGGTELLDSNANPVGLLEGAEFEERILQLKPGDRLFFYTDGLTEAENPFQSELGDDRVVQAIDRCRDISMDDTVHSLMNDLDEWCGHRPLRDDVSVLSLEVVGNQGGGK
jgi:PAS domain S-box-containing protein